MLSGQPISAENGLAMGLVDKVVPPSQLLSAAKGAALELAASAAPRRRTLQLSQHMQQSGEGFVAAAAAVADAQARVNRSLAGQQHYLLLLEAVAAGLAQGAPTGLQLVRVQLPAACCWFQGVHSGGNAVCGGLRLRASCASWVCLCPLRCPPAPRVHDMLHASP